ncbi:MAG TPA: RdgB/HAM1 family non-canonical purine NTP pyrophosphatase [Pyrinomonadaceae bacterium]|nr:RdgB/HAM1 family non-canonical purine NTP pyrophosphatase [Acidobacteriota bacterium]HQZ95061.1 RdgB/HAM1 family non-canonical purine NTP pyrophosphatase [Pyrinomonadaceae bacterium]
MDRKLLIATNNQGKVAELQDLIADFPIELLSLADFPAVVEVDETGSTFAENAELKAAGYARQTSSFALADDSGLEVDALDGRPGVLSARYGGEATTFAEKISMLIDEMKAAESDERRARFVCSISIADTKGTILFTADGVCKGRIADSPRGAGGFGYDPLFIPDGFAQTFGELDRSTKQTISHRSRAFQQIIPFLRHFKLG